MKTRIIITMIWIVVFISISRIFTMIRSPLEARIAVEQLKDSVLWYSLSRDLIRNNIIENSINYFCIGGIVLLWIKPFYKLIKKATI